MSFHRYSWKYLISGLAGTPTVLRQLLSGLEPTNAIWDFRPDNDRFTLREITGHLAAWEAVFVDRVERTRDEDEPLISTPTENWMTADWGYQTSEPSVNMEKFAGTRLRLVDALKSLPDNATGRILRRDPYPEMSIGMQAVLILGHDGYHLEQISEWIAKYRHD